MHTCRVCARGSSIDSELAQLDVVVETVNQFKEEMEGLCTDLKVS